MSSISLAYLLVLNYFPVAPIKTRPCVISDAMTCDDDLTVKYVEILKAILKMSKVHIF